MANLQCPNCKKYTFSPKMDKLGCGCLMVIGVPFVYFVLLPGTALIHGGTIPSGGWIISLISLIIGLFLIFYSFIFPTDTEKYSCSDCKYEETRKKVK